MIENEGKLFYTRKEMMEMFDVTRQTLWNWVNQGFFAVFKAPTNGNVLYLADDVNRFIRENIYKYKKQDK